MATKSILKSVSISGEQPVKQFVEALETAKELNSPSITIPHTDVPKSEIKELFRGFKC